MIKSYLILGSAIVALSSLSIHSIKKNSALETEIDRQIDISKQLSYLVTETQNSYEIELSRRASLQEEFDKVTKDANQKISKLESDLRIADDSSSKLLDKLRKTEQSRDSAKATVSGGELSERSGAMCPDLFERIDRAATEYARYADRVNIALYACRSEYDAYQKYISSRIIHKYTE